MSDGRPVLSHSEWVAETRLDEEKAARKQARAKRRADWCFALGRKVRSESAKVWKWLRAERSMKRY